MPRVKGFLRIMRRRGQGGPVDPDYGVDEGEHPGYPEGPEVEPPDIEPPPGIWPPPTENHPVQPLPPDEHVPPGSIWPRPPGAHAGKFIVLARIPGMGWKYVVIDPSTWPEPEEGEPGHGLPGRPTKPATRPA
jgi:hypothetical protein